MESRVEAENRIEALEMKSAYQEHLLQELNEVIISQQNQIDQLSGKLDVVYSQLKQSGVQIEKPENEVPPPHY